VCVDDHRRLAARSGHAGDGLGCARDANDVRHRLDPVDPTHRDAVAAVANPHHE
jgi:alkylhydroperoxidase family enzyme